MKRKISQQLLDWKTQKARKPLILQGARQVGKTYALEQFARESFSEFLRIDLDKDKTAREIFSRDLDPKRIVNALRIRYEKSLDPEQCLIIFDEIQECPDALNSLKYFCEDAPEFHIAAAGSLLGVKLANSHGFPVGKVEFLKLFPMSFLEFLQAIGREQLHDYLTQINKVAPLESVIHQDLCELFKIYCYVGGMPEAVQCYIDDNNLNSVRTIQEAMITAYIYDFAKHAPHNQVMKITGVWNSLPEQLGKENKKFKFSLVHKHARLRDYHEAVQWLIDAGLVYPVFNITTPRLPLSGYLDTNAFKLYMLDVGLLGAMSQLSANAILEENRLFTEYKGALTENVAIQLLHNAGLKQFYYWTLNQKAEVDFILQVGQNAVPLEIKSGLSTKKKSLQLYTEKYPPPVNYRASLLNLKQDGKLINYPLYLLEAFPI